MENCLGVVLTYVKPLIGPLAHKLCCTLPDCLSRVEDWLLEKSAKIQAAVPQKAEAWRLEHDLTLGPHWFESAHGEDKRMPFQ